MWSFFQSLLSWHMQGPSSFQCFQSSHFSRLHPDQFRSVITLYWNNSNPVKQPCREAKNEYQVELYQTLLTYFPALCQSCVVESTNHNKIELEMRHKIYPIISDQGLCTMLLVSNLAQPEWINIGCTKKFLEDIICVSNKSHYDSHHATFEVVSDSCQPDSIKVLTTCLIFLWCNSTETVESMHQKPLSTRNLQNVSVQLQGAILVALPLLITFESKTNIFHTLQVTKHLNIIDIKMGIKTQLSTKGYIVFEQKPKPLQTTGNLFSCKLGGFVLQTHVCDGNLDCINDHSDEARCLCNDTCDAVTLKKAFCKHIQTKAGNTCGSLFHKSLKGVCQVYIKTSKIQPAEKAMFAVCPSGKQIAHILINDMISDCDSGADEIHLISFLKHNTPHLCKDPSLLPCRPGLEQCFKIIETCFFKLDDNGRLTPCSNGGNLQQCQKYDCDYNFKCPSSYCLGWSDICDAKWDCINGADENFEYLCKNRVKMCKYMFRCRPHSLVCIPLFNTCDGNDDCISGSDELFCNLQSITCPGECLCLGYGILCSNGRVSFTKIDMVPFMSLVVIHATILQSLKEFHTRLLNMKHLRYDNSSLQQICASNLPQSLSQLSVLGNNIQKLYSQCFEPALGILVLILDKNNISCMDKLSFSGMSLLLMLSLSNNPLLILNEEVFQKSAENKLNIFLLNVSLDEVDSSVFDSVTISRLFTTDYHLCCIVEQTTVCTALIPWHSPCTDLLPEKSLLILFIVVSATILVFTFLSVVLHSANKDFAATFRSNIISLNINDILMIIYLTTIWVTSIMHQGEFATQEQKWRSSILCLSCSVLIFIFKFCSVFLLVLLSINKLMVVISPVTTKFKQTSHVVKCIFVLATVSIALGGIYCIILLLTTKQMPTNLCLPFLDPSKKIILVTTTTSFVAAAEIIAALVCAILHGILLHEFQASEQNLKGKVSKKTSSVGLIAQLILVTSSNIVCWLPANVFFITAIFLKQYPTKLFIWMAVCVLPFNSFFNPIIFVIFCLRSICEES